MAGLTNHKNSLSGNVIFDRAYAVRMIKAEAKKAGDLDTVNIPDGIVYSYMVTIMRDKRNDVKATERALDILRQFQEAGVYARR